MLPGYLIFCAIAEVPHKAAKVLFDEFDRESDLVENNIDMLRQIVKKKQNRPIKFSNGQMKVDLMTASAIIGVYDKVNKSNKAKIERMVNGDKSQFLKMQSAAFKLAR